MTFIHFPRTASLWTALSMAEANPNDVTVIGDVEFVEDDVGTTELHVDTFVVGRNATLPSRINGREVRALYCNDTFLYLGRMERVALEVFAENIVLLNDVYSTGPLHFAATETFATYGSIEGPGKLSIKGERIFGTATILNHRKTVTETKATLTNERGEVVGEMIVGREVEEWHESQIDAATRMFKELLTQEDALSVYYSTREIARQMGLVPIR